MAGPQSTFVKGVAVTTSDLINKNPTYTDPYESAPSLKLSNYFYDVPELGAYKPGRSLGGLDWDQATSLMDLRSLSDYDINIPALKLPDATAMLPGQSNSVRTGSFEINMLDIPESLRLLSGQTIGQEEPLAGTTQGQNVVSDFALQFLNDYSTMPGKLLDYGIALPITWGQAALGQSTNPNQLVNVDGSAVYKFQETPEYWNLLRTVTADDQLMAIARQTASRATGGALVDALTAQLFDLMRRDRDKLSGLSSGNERVDYLAKMNLQAVLAMGSASGGQNVGLLNMLNPFDGAFLTMWDEAAKMALRGALTFIPLIGTGLASTIDPVRAETQAAWLKLQAQDRTGLAFNAQMQTLGYDLALMLPMFNGIGAVISVTKAGAGGATFDSWLAAQAATNVSMQGALDVLKVGLSAGRTLPVAVQRGAYAAGRFGFDVPEVVAASRLWGMGEGLARIAGPGMSLATPGRISLIPDGYDAVMAMGRLFMAEGLAAWTANYAAKAFMPGYSQTLGRTIDQSHWVSESSFAAIVDNIGLMAGGAFGAATLYRATKGAFGWTGERVGFKGSPVMDMWESQIGDVVDGQVTSAFGRPPAELRQAFSNQIYDVTLNHTRDQIAQYAMKIWQADPTDAGMAKAVDYLTREASNAEAVALDILTLIKNAADGSFGPAARNAAREAMQEMAVTMEADSGVFRLAQRLYDRALPYTPDGVKQWIAHTASFLGWDAAGAEKLAASIGKWNGLPRSARAQMDPWRKAANAVAQVAYNHFNGVLKAIVDSGTSAEAARLHIVRVDHLFRPEAQRYIDLYKSFTDGKSTADEVEALKNQLMKTAEMREWYARKRPGKYDEPTLGERTLETASAKDVYNYVAQIKDSLDTKRVTPGATSTPGELNDLHLLLEQHGSWTLAFKPEESTALGVLREQMEQARAAQLAWDSDAVRFEAEWRRLAQERQQLEFDVQGQVESTVTRKGLDAARDRANAAYKLWMDEQSVQANDPAAVNPQKLTRLEQAYYTLDSKLADAQERFDKRVEAAVAKDPRIIEAKRLEQEAHDLHYSHTQQDRPLGLRVGPVAPAGFVIDPAELALAEPRFASMLDDFYRQYPDEPHGFFHATTYLDDIIKEGLLNREELAKAGKSTAGTGGGARATESSTTISYAHAQQWVYQLGLMADIMQGKAGIARILEDYAVKWGHIGFDDATHVVDAIVHESGIGSFRGAVNRAFRDRGLDPNDVLSWQGDEAWAAIEDALRKEPPSNWHIMADYADPKREFQIAAHLHQVLDAALPEEPGARVVITGDPWTKFNGQKLDRANIGIVRVAFDPARTAGIKPGADYWGYEIAGNTTHTFTFKELPGQAHGDPWEMPAQDWSVWGAEKQPVSYITTRDPITGETAVFKAPYLQYPMSGADILNIGNRNILARKMDDIFRGFRSWRITQYQRGQLFRIFTGTYEVTPEQVDAFAAGMGRLAYEKWSPVQGRGELPMGAQAAARLRADDVNELAARIFGKIDTGRKDANGNAIFEPAPMRNRVTGEMETPKWADMAADAYRQAWTINLTSGLTSRLYNINFFMLGHAAQLTGNWIVPMLRYVASPVFKASEIFESKGFNWMRMTKDVRPEDLAAYQSSGLGYVGIGAELRSGEQMGEVMALSQAAAPSAAASAVGLDSVQGGHRVASLLRKDALRRGWDYIANPTPMKDKLETRMAVQTIRKEFPAILRAGDREAYDFFRTVLKVPDDELAAFIVRDRELYQAWVDGTGSFEDLILHSSKFAPEMTQPGPAVLMRDHFLTVDQLNLSRLGPNFVGYAYKPIGPKMLEQVVRDGVPLGADSPGGTPVRSLWWEPLEVRPTMAPANYVLVRTAVPGLRSSTQVPGMYEVTEVVKPVDLEYLGADHMWHNLVDVPPTRASVPVSPELEAFYKSPEWQATQAMMRLAAKAAQQEAYGVHYFGSYRSAFERSINHPLLGVYPASWAYKAAKEWFKFLFDNHSFGDGNLSLGAVPAAYLQSVMHAQSVAFAQFNDTDLQTWMRQGPLGNAMFVFNLLMPGDWSNIPFPASRSIRMLLRGEYDPIQHFMQNLFGPRGQGGIGAIRDLNMARLVGGDVMDALTTHKGDSRWQKIIEGLDKNGNPPKPVDWDTVTKFPVPITQQTLSEPIR